MLITVSPVPAAVIGPRVGLSLHPTVYYATTGLSVLGQPRIRAASPAMLREA